MFNPRGGFPGQRPMGRMNQPGLNHMGMNMPSMNMSGMGMSNMSQPSMNLPGMNQPSMNLPSMNQPPMNLPSMNQPTMNLSGMSQPNMNLPGMSQPNMNLSGMSQPNMNTGMNRMGHTGMNPNMGLGNVNQPALNAYRIGDSGMNQGGMGFQSEIKSPGFGMRQMDSPGSYLGGNSDAMGMKSMPLRPPEAHMGPQGMPQRFPAPSTPMNQGQPRMMMQSQEIPSIVNRVVTHSSDHLRGNPKPPLQEPAHLVDKKPLNSLGLFDNLNPDMGIKPGPSSALDQMANTPNRYTNESASSILQSFGLSNEDLEELSRYPDDQLTPENLPNILRDIRLRKMNRTGGSHDQGGGSRRPASDVLPSKVIDYGHSSKYKYSDRPAPSRPFDSRKEQKPSPVSKEQLPSNVKNNKGGDAMDNKIPTISSSRKTPWQNTKPDRSNNKTLVGEQTNAKASDSSVNAENPVITIQTDSTALGADPVNLDTSSTNMAAESPIGTVVSQVSYPPPAEATPPTGKGSWAPSNEETQKMKRMPTPSMKNDYFAASPRIFPHICSLCNVECRHLKDWIKHQNTTTHIDSCRKLRQQYPDWNPQVHTLSRNEGKKDETNPKSSRSKSGSPRRSRRSGSRSRARRSRSRSPRSGRRSRSPRRSRHSPRRSRSPRKSARSPRRSLSPRRHRRGRSSTPPDKRAVDAAVRNFIVTGKLESGEKGRHTRSSADAKKLPTESSNSNAKGKKPTGSPSSTRNTGNTAKKESRSSSHSSTSKKPGSSSSVKSDSSSNGGDRRKQLASRKPSSSAPTKHIVSTGAKKTSAAPAKKPNESNSQKGQPNQPASEPFNPLNKFANKSLAEKMIHVTNLPDSGYTDQDILKVVQPFGKVCDILIIRSKNEAFLETSFKEAASAAVKFSETKPVIINGKHVILSLVSHHNLKATETKSTSETDTKPPPQKAAEKPKEVKPQKEKERKKKPEPSKHNINVPPGFIKCHRLADPSLKEADQCVVVISNLPDKHTVEEISNLAKPFGGVNDILVISNYHKAYLELPSRTSVDSMLKFYSVFPICLSGNSLTIAMAPRFKDLKDEDLIFAEIIEQTQYKITPTIYSKFVYLSNLPDKEIEEFEITRIGLRFGKVEHYIVLSNKRKAILHLSSPASVTGMHNFLSQFPARIGEATLTCSLPAKTKFKEDEYITYLEEKKSPKPNENTHEEEEAPTVGEVGQQEEQLSSDDHTTETDENPAGSVANVEIEEEEEENEDDEEAAEAPEAPEAPEALETPLPFFIEPEPVVEQSLYSADPQPYVTEESDVLVSVESDEEECEAPCPTVISPSILYAVPVMDTASMEHLLTAEDSDESESNPMETSTNETLANGAKPVDNTPAVDEGKDLNSLEAKTEDAVKEELGVEGAAPETTTKESESSSMEIIPPSIEETSTKAEEDSVKEPKSESSPSPKEGNNKCDEETTHEEKPAQKQEDGQSSQGKNTEVAGETSEEPKGAEQVALTTKTPLTRTAKYNPQKGELCVTLTVDSQKSSSRTADSRKRYSGDKISSGRESSTPKSISSNRSSPSEGNPKSSSGSYQTKSSYRGVSGQDRDSKGARSRDTDYRSNRKDDKPKERNSSSSRHTRSSSRSTRGQKSKEEEDLFPFNLDEFVTVDEIVEEHTEEGKDQKPETTPTNRRGGKRKENYSSASSTKKPKEASGDTQEPSFVTLDEVSLDEEEKKSETTTDPESNKDVEAPSQMKVDTVDEESAPPPSAQDSNVLMTLDEVSDDEEPNASTVQRSSSVIPDKDQLLTLDEISGEDEEQTSHTEPPNQDEGSAQKTESQDGNSIADPEAKTDLEPPNVPPQEPVQETPVEQTLLTLDEVKADDEEDFLADIENQFLTVDEVGEEEEDMQTKEEEEEKLQTRSANKTGQNKSKASPKDTKTDIGLHDSMATPPADLHTIVQTAVRDFLAAERAKKRDPIISNADCDTSQGAVKRPWKDCNPPPEGERLSQKRAKQMSSTPAVLQSADPSGDAHEPPAGEDEEEHDSHGEFYMPNLEAEGPSVPQCSDSMAEDKVIDPQGEAMFDPRTIGHPRSSKWSPPDHIARYVQVWLRKPLDQDVRDKLRAECPRPVIPGKVTSTPEFDDFLATFLQKPGRDPRQGLDKSLKSVQDKLLDLSGPLTRILMLADKAFTEKSSLDPAVVREWAQRSICLLGNANSALSTERRKSALLRLDSSLAHLADREPGYKADGKLFGDSFISELREHTDSLTNLTKMKSSLKKTFQTPGVFPKGGRPRGRGASRGRPPRGHTKQFQVNPSVSRVPFQRHRGSFRGGRGRPSYA